MSTTHALIALALAVAAVHLPRYRRLLALLVQAGWLRLRIALHR